MPSTYSVGIDLGTTQSAAALVDAAGATQMIRNAEGEVLTPSVALFEGEEVVVGRDAKRARSFAADRIAETAKRDMGQSHYRHPIHGKLLPPEVIQGCILKKLREDIVTAIGESFQAVITVPAYFDEQRRRKAMADAGQMSGLEVLDIVNEPTAAAMAFGERLGYLDSTGSPRDTLTLLVYDLGGGTFDVTIIRLGPGDVTTLATDGDAELGGFNWDMRLVEHVVGKFRERYPQCPDPDERSRRQLRQAVEEFKHTLSGRPETTIPFEFGGESLSVSISRDEFESMTADLVERTRFTTGQALKAAGLLWSDIDRMLLVGGSTRMPMIQHMLEDISGLTPDVNVNPDEAVARGAAIYAQHLLGLRGTGHATDGLRVSDVNAHSLGIEGINQKTLRKENVVLIPRNTRLPTEVHRKFVTKEDNQQSVRIQLLEGESTLPGQCTELAKAAIRNLPPGLPEGTKIDVCYRFAANGRLSVEAHLSGGGREAKIELDRLRGLTDERVAKWKKILCDDGGFIDIEDYAMGVLNNDEEIWRPEPVTDSSGQPEEEDPAPEPHRDTLEPAVPVGAPVAASEKLKQEEHEHAEKQEIRAAERTIKAKGRRSLLVPILVLLGHLIASVAGLAIAYYLLCYVRPEANFLELDLPGLEPPPASRAEP